MPPRRTTPSKVISSAPGRSREIAVRVEPIELCRLLKFAGLAESGGDAKQVISQRKVMLNGAIETQKRKKVMAGDRVTYADQTIIVTLQ